MNYKIAVAVLTAGLLAGCSQTDAILGDQTSSTLPVIQEAETLAARGQREQAAAVLRVAAARDPSNPEIRAAYGKSLLITGQVGDAERVLAQAHTPDKPNPSVLNAQGVVAAQKGDFTTAIAFFDRSLNLQPAPTVMTNKAMTLALAGRMAEAEALAGRAAADPKSDARVRQSYALLLAMQGKEQAAKEAYRQDMSAEQAAANVSMVNRMRKGA